MSAISPRILLLMLSNPRRNSSHSFRKIDFFRESQRKATLPTFQLPSLKELAQFTLSNRAIFKLLDLTKYSLKTSCAVLCGIIESGFFSLHPLDQKGSEMSLATNGIVARGPALLLGRRRSPTKSSLSGYCRDRIFMDRKGSFLVRSIGHTDT